MAPYQLCQTYVDEGPLINETNSPKWYDGFPGKKRSPVSNSTKRIYSPKKKKDSETVLQHPSTKKKAPILIVKHPNFPRHQLSLIEDKYDAPDFTYYLKAFLNAFTTNKLSNQHLDHSKLLFHYVNVYNMF